MTKLAPCPHCSRHVVAGEPTCPFCAGALPADLAAPRSAPRARLGRAAVFAFGVAATGCGDNEKPHVPVDAAVHVDAAPDAAIDADPDGGGVPIYAAAPTQDPGSGSRV